MALNVGACPFPGFFGAFFRGFGAFPGFFGAFFRGFGAFPGFFGAFPRFFGAFSGVLALFPDFWRFFPGFWELFPGFFGGKNQDFRIRLFQSGGRYLAAVVLVCRTADRTKIGQT
jgi:hypothetical protein